MSATRLPEQKCPVCDTELSAATNLSGGGGPEPGDVTVCAKCSTILQFGERLVIARMTRADFDALPADTMRELARVQTALRLMHSTAAGTA